MTETPPPAPPPPPPNGDVRLLRKLWAAGCGLAFFGFLIADRYAPPEEPTSQYLLAFLAANAILGADLTWDRMEKMLGAILRLYRLWKGLDK